MLLKDFAAILPSIPSGAGDENVTGITADSRVAAPGNLFAALSGTKANGADFANDAAARGAAESVDASKNFALALTY